MPLIRGNKEVHVVMSGKGPSQWSDQKVGGRGPGGEEALAVAARVPLWPRSSQQRLEALKDCIAPLLGRADWQEYSVEMTRGGVWSVNWDALEGVNHTAAVVQRAVLPWRTEGPLAGTAVLVPCTAGREDRTVVWLVILWWRGGRVPSLASVQPLLGAWACVVVAGKHTAVVGNACTGQGIWVLPEDAVEVCQAEAV